jgi:hypothetical protein
MLANLCVRTDATQSQEISAMEKGSARLHARAHLCVDAEVHPAVGVCSLEWVSERVHKPIVTSNRPAIDRTI